MTEATEPRWFLLLRAACSFADRFTQQDLAVRAWTMFPGVFGLAGYADTHPDANATNAKLYGHTGIVSRGYVEPCGDGMFRVTGEGRRTRDAGSPDPRPKRIRTRPGLTCPTPAARPLVEVFAATRHTTTLGNRFIGVPR